MTTSELREALTVLMQTDPEFLKDLIGDVVKENLKIVKRSDNDYYNPSAIHSLNWGSYYKDTEFSTTY